MFVADTQSEVRPFTMHTNLLRDVITRQAGSIDKAVVEGVMNLSEAGATEGRITLTKDELCIEDNGRGFQSREEILEVFEVFGKSDERKAEEKTWAEFQMGRGQLMAFGVTIYRTRGFEMVVDIRSCGEEITYTLTEGLENVVGCKVTVRLYEPIESRSLEWKCGDIRRAIHFVDVPVFLNGDQCSFPPAGQDWDFITEDAYIKIGGHSLNLYNRGVFVKSVSNKECGVGGVVVSRKRLKLNFARNDVIADCPVWTRVATFVREKSQAELLGAKSPNEEQVNLIITNWRSGYFTLKDIYGCKLFRDTNGKRWCLASLAAHGFPYFTLDDKQSVRADKAMQVGYGIVFDYRFTRDAFRVVTTEEEVPPANVLCELFEAAADRRNLGYNKLEPLPPMQYLDADELYDGLEESNVLLDESEYTSAERCALAALATYNYYYAQAFDGQGKRRLLLGVSDSAEAWTDGAGFIAFDRRYMNKAVKTVSGWCSLLLVYAHEYAHVKTDSLTHDDGFLDRHERYSMKSMHYLEKILACYATGLRALNRKITKKLSRPGELVAESEGLVSAAELSHNQLRRVL